MKKFVSSPSTFEGLSPQTSFTGMIARNATSLLQVYRKAEILFARLSMLRDKMKAWVLLGMLDFDAFVEHSILSLDDYDANFAALKSKRRELDKITDLQRIDCITVHLGPFKAAIDMTIQRATDAIVVHLRRNLISCLHEVEQYLDNGSTTMAMRPASLGDIAKAQKSWKELTETRAVMKSQTAQCEERRRLLVVMGTGLIDVSEINSRMTKLNGNWEAFDSALDAFAGVVDEQRKALRGNVSKEVDEASAQIDKAASRWQALRPTSLKSWDRNELAQVLANLDEWNATVGTLQDMAQEVIENAGSFGLDVPEFQQLERLQVRLSQL
jgi:dynein heavy chain 2